jgi:hypothetical protein
MRSPHESRDSGHADEVETTVQDTLDAFEETEAKFDVVKPTSEVGTSAAASPPQPLTHETHQESIDSFSPSSEDRQRKVQETSRPSRALEGLALEMEMERVALSEAAAGISRDELLITIARQVAVPLERLDLVDGYLTDLELEGKVRRVGDSVVLCRPDDGDLLAMDLTESEFLGRYRKRYLDATGGGRG